MLKDNIEVINIPLSTYMLTGWKAAWQKRTWGSWWTPSWKWVSNVPLCQGRLNTSWAALGPVLPAG